MCVFECLYLHHVCEEVHRDQKMKLIPWLNVTESCEPALSMKKSNKGPLQSNKHSQLMSHIFSPKFISFYINFGLAFEVTAP